MTRNGLFVVKYDLGNFSHFPSIGSDDPPLPPPLGVENVKIGKNSEKKTGDPLKPFLGP